MSRVSPQEVAGLARLSRLSLGHEERERLAAQLAQILAYIETLREVDVEGVEEYVGVEVPVVLREDVPGPVLPVEDALACVPAVRDDQVEVPRFKED
jgi:aspartyl-tRNA(Asn)/glutamyl-tRNA(Gln) amidotransferase subunit C